MKQQNLGRRRLGLQTSDFSLRSSRGFTLIELLVAMGILMVIVLMMANLFQQTTVAWETGTRQAEAGLEARAVLGMIQHEVSQAVGGGERAFTASGPTLDFWTLGEITAGTREARRVGYRWSGSQVSRRVDEGGYIPLLANVTRFDVIPSPSSTNAPPAWVDVYLEVRAQRDRSQIRVYAIGREGIADTRR